MLGLFLLSEFKTRDNAQVALEIFKGKDWKLKGRHALTPRHLQAWLKDIHPEPATPSGLQIVPPLLEKHVFQVMSVSWWVGKVPAGVSGSGLWPSVSGTQSGKTLVIGTTSFRLFVGLFFLPWPYMFSRISNTFAQNPILILQGGSVRSFEGPGWETGELGNS